MTFTIRASELAAHLGLFSTLGTKLIHLQVHANPSEAMITGWPLDPRNPQPDFSFTLKRKVKLEGNKEDGEICTAFEPLIATLKKLGDAEVTLKKVGKTVKLGHPDGSLVMEEYSGPLPEVLPLPVKAPKLKIQARNLANAMSRVQSAAKRDKGMSDNPRLACLWLETDSSDSGSLKLGATDQTRIQQVTLPGEALEEDKREALSLPLGLGAFLEYLGETDVTLYWDCNLFVKSKDILATMQLPDCKPLSLLAAVKRNRPGKPLCTFVLDPEAFQKDVELLGAGSRGVERHVEVCCNHKGVLLTLHSDLATSQVLMNPQYSEPGDGRAVFYSWPAFRELARASQGLDNLRFFQGDERQALYCECGPFAAVLTPVMVASHADSGAAEAPETVKITEKMAA